MRSPPPAAAALLLAALAALPYRGTEADVTSTLLNTASVRRMSYSTLSKTYQRLHVPYSALADPSPRTPRRSSRRIYNSNITTAECSANKINIKSRRAGSGGLEAQKLPCEITMNNADSAAPSASDSSKVAPERNHKRRKRGKPGATEPPLKVAVQPFPFNTSLPPVAVAVSIGSSAPPSIHSLSSGSANETLRVSPTMMLSAIAAALSGSSPQPSALAVALRPTTAPDTALRPIPQQDKRRKPDTGSGAPLLNYIFDTYSNAHQHRNDRPVGGGGGGRMTAAAPAVEALVGSTAQLDCKVDALHDKLVSWVRRKGDGEGMDLLTTGTQKYTADDRYSSRFLAPDTWRLEIRDVRAADAALYDCQLSAHPPRTARVALHVPAVSVEIVDGAGARVGEQVCEVGSTVTLRCVVRGLRMEGGRALHWYRRDALLNDDTTRGGISVRTELGAEGAESVLHVARVASADAGQYTCAVHDAPASATAAAALPPARVVLHVIQGESLAELHAGGGGPRCGGGGGGGTRLLLLTLVSSFYLTSYY